MSEQLKPCRECQGCRGKWTPDPPGMIWEKCTNCSAATPSEGGGEVPIQRVDVEMLKGGRWRWIDTPDGLVVRHTDHVAYVQRIVAAKDAEIARLWDDRKKDAALIHELSARPARQVDGDSHGPGRQVGDDWPKLDKPAKVGGGRFNVGVSARLVVEAAQRQYEYDVTPEKEAERIAKAADFLGSLQGGRQVGGDERADFEAYCRSKGWEDRHLKRKADRPEIYDDWSIQPLWLAWQARAALAPVSSQAGGDELQRKADLFDQYANEAEAAGFAGVGEWLDALQESLRLVTLARDAFDKRLTEWQQIAETEAENRMADRAALTPAAVACVIPERIPQHLERSIQDPGRNATLDEVARLNRNPIPVGLLERLQHYVNHCDFSEPEWNGERELLQDELRALRSKD